MSDNILPEGKYVMRATGAALKKSGNGNNDELVRAMTPAQREKRAALHPVGP